MTILSGDQSNAGQIDYWNGPAGERWRARQQDQDFLLAPVTEALLQRAAPIPGEVVLDIGCGCGETTIELARRVVPGGQVLGLDISAPMLQRARERAPSDLPISSIMADATAYPFEAGAGDLLFSRFGVMFFAEPAKSFANMRAGLRRGGRLVFACWREPAENPWLMLPLEAACRHVPRPPAPEPGEPGAFAFADGDRVRGILCAAGFRKIGLEGVGLSLDIGLGRGLDTAVAGAMEIGPTGRALDGHPPEIRAAAAESIRAALMRYQAGDAVRLPGAIWIVTAVNP